MQWCKWCSNAPPSIYLEILICGSQCENCVIDDICLIQGLGNWQVDKTGSKQISNNNNNHFGCSKLLVQLYIILSVHSELWRHKGRENNEWLGCIFLTHVTVSAMTAWAIVRKRNRIFLHTQCIWDISYPLYPYCYITWL